MGDRRQQQQVAGLRLVQAVSNPQDVAGTSTTGAAFLPGRLRRAGA